MLKKILLFKGLSIDLGAAFALQFQAINSFNGHKGSSFTNPSGAAITGYKLNNLANNLNLPTANMTIGAQLYDGVRVNLDLYLAARHHNETWVKGGYLQIRLYPKRLLERFHEICNYQNWSNGKQLW